MARERAPETFFCAYNLFRRREESDLYCAVPEDCVVPRFLDQGDWMFDGKAIDVSTAPPGFDVRAAAVGVRFNGFHLFQARAPHKRALSVVRGGAG
jgi:hypothetical protein